MQPRALLVELTSLSQEQRSTNEKLGLLLDRAHAELCLLALADPDTALDLLLLLGLASRAYFVDSGTVAPGATRTFTINPPGSDVGLIETFNVDISLSDAFSMIVDFDAKQILNDPVVTAGPIHLPTRWFVFSNEFRIRMTNNDPLAQTIKVHGSRSFLREDAWHTVRQNLKRAMTICLGGQG